MPYSTLKWKESKFGSPSAYYVVEGDFDEMFYLCADVFHDKMEGDKIFAKTDEELAEEYRDRLQRLFLAVGKFMDNEYIKDYSLVLTPNVCDSKELKYTAPKKNNNFIVTPFNYEEIQLVEKVIVPSGRAGGTIRKSDDRNRRPGTYSELDAYVALQLNSEHPDYHAWKEHGKESSQYDHAIFSLSLLLGDAAASYMKGPLRSFLRRGVRTQNGHREPVFVEQYFDNHVPKTKKFALGEGYVRGQWRGLKPENINKYIAFKDLFKSTGPQFCNYGLSREELAEGVSEFKASPWVPIEYKEED